MTAQNLDLSIKKAFCKSKQIKKHVEALINFILHQIIFLKFSNQPLIIHLLLFKLKKKIIDLKRGELELL